MKKILLSAVLIVAIITPAYAKMHSASQRDHTISICKGSLTAQIPPESLIRMAREAGADAEDVDYLLDMCVAYNQGRLDSI